MQQQQVDDFLADPAKKLTALNVASTNLKVLSAKTLTVKYTENYGEDLTKVINKLEKVGKIVTRVVECQEVEELACQSCWAASPSS